MARRASTPPGPGSGGRHGGFGATGSGSHESQPGRYQSTSGGGYGGGNGYGSGGYPAPPGGQPPRTPTGYAGPPSRTNPLLGGGPPTGSYQPPGFDDRSIADRVVPPGGPQHGRGAPTGPGPGRRRLIDYPRNGRDGFTRWIPSWKLVSALIGLGFLTVIVLFIAAYAATSVPPPDAKISAQTTLVYYADGTTQIGSLSTQNRQLVKFNEVPVDVQNAVLAAEDHTFWTNSGVNPKSLVRAAWSNARGNATQGGSTITQQYVKNVFDLRDRTVKRKAQEFFIALKINRTKSKEEILERYLNTIYMGRGAYGIQAASKAYFGASMTVQKLNVSQAAFLAGLINAPSLSDPNNGGQERAERRWSVVLDAMVADGKLDATKRAGLTFPKVNKSAPGTSMEGQKGYMITMAKKAAMAQLGKTEDEILTGGYKIVTTFQKKLVLAANKAVHDQLTVVKGRPANVQAAVVTIDPSDGAVRAIYGGPDWVTHPFNNAVQGTAEAGSTFKAFGLAAALKDGYSLQSRFSGASPKQFPGHKVRNFGNEQYRLPTLLDATAHSVNTVYVALNQEVGPEKTQAAAYAAGIPKTANVEDNIVNVLGSANPHPIDMANAYATFAAGGVRHTPYILQSIGQVSTGKTDDLFKVSKIQGDKVFSKDVVDDLTFALQQVVKRGSGSYASRLSRDVAGKTGTSSGSRSAWFVGYTPQYATAVAMFQNNDDGTGSVAMKGFGGVRSITGGSFPVKIWTQYMDAALNGKPKLDFDPPANGGKFMGTPLPKPVVTASPTPSATTQPEPSVSVEPSATFSLPLPSRDPIFPTFDPPGQGKPKNP